MGSTNKVVPKTALLSVSDKTGIVPFAQFLQERGVKIIATGGTAKKLRENGIKVRSVSSLTRFPEIFGGRVKSIHPNIVGGILGQREKDRVEAKKNNIRWIDLVVCNLYPFEKIARNPKSLLDEKIENIDIVHTLLPLVSWIVVKLALPITRFNIIRPATSTFIFFFAYSIARLLDIAIIPALDAV